MRSGLSIVAIDGPAASGKGTLARMLADFLHFSHLDTGSLYRLVTYLWLRGLGVRKSAELQTPDTMSTNARDAAVSIARSLTRADIASADVKSLRSETVSKAASRIAPIPEVRTALTQLQRNCVRRQPPGNAWLGGRRTRYRYGRLSRRKSQDFLDRTMRSPSAKKIKRVASAGKTRYVRRCVYVHGRPRCFGSKSVPFSSGAGGGCLPHRFQRFSAGGDAPASRCHCQAGRFRSCVGFGAARATFSSCTHFFCFSVFFNDGYDGFFFTVFNRRTPDSLQSLAGDVSSAQSSTDDAVAAQASSEDATHDNATHDDAAHDDAAQDDAAQDDAAQDEDFDALLDESFGGVARLEGVIVRGRVTEIIDNQVFVDVGLKSYGRIDRQEFVGQGESDSIAAGDTVEVYIERLEGRNGEAVLSRARARREEAWCALEEAFEKGQPVKGLVVSRVKGGLTVEVMGTHAFLPGSQVDVRPVRDLSSFLQTEHEFSILKMDRARGNIVVSRRTFLEKSQPQRSDPAEVFHAGMVVKGVVKNLTDYGAFRRSGRNRRTSARHGHAMEARPSSLRLPACGTANRSADLAHQSRKPTHQSGDQATPGRSMEKYPGKISSGLHLLRTRYEPHRLRRFR